MRVLDTIKRFQGWAFAGALAAVLAACGGGGGGAGGNASDSTTGSSGTSGTTSLALQTSGSNVVTLTVAAGPNPDLPNTGFVTVKVCSPTDATLCDTIPNVLVDTGSVGLRVLASKLTNTLSSLTQQVDTTSGNGIDECEVFASSYTWGTVREASVTLGSETTSAGQNIQVINDTSTQGPVPTDCDSAGAGNIDNSASSLGANGIVGVNGIQYDCGTACVSASTPVDAYYYRCPSTTSACASINVPLAKQIANVVYGMATDNNGVIIQLPAISGSGAVSATGALILGIGTQSNNALESASPIPTDAYGDFTATMNGSSIANSFVDTGSTAYTFTQSQLGLSICTDSGLTDFFCPSSTTTEPVVFTDTSGASANRYSGSISIASAASVLEGASANYAIDDVAAVNTYVSISGLDFGMPFFYARNVYIGNQTGIDGTGGYVAVSPLGS
ncbi:DUF3443 family protein [Pararobbsia silviterrae]|uniref:DUF3443 family protein n=1 Tax=Pararobbsia silviterrae TaxID=1792498 RepID=A0A494Y942_9BURK|nr:DUF3443 family protein [Pararobbsia silviterrae]RKP59161.1 DUF3443 family protein [Pararobbsia silviterrae]